MYSNFYFRSDMIYYYNMKVTEASADDTCKAFVYFYVL